MTAPRSARPARTSLATPGVGSTPARSATPPAEATPAPSASSSMGPERRVSRPIDHDAGAPRAALAREPARPRARGRVRARGRAASAVRDAADAVRAEEATRHGTALALGELRAAPAPLRPAFLRSTSRASRVRKPCSLELRAQLGIGLDERAGDAVAQRTGLAGDAAAVAAGAHVEALAQPGRARAARSRRAQRRRAPKYSSSARPLTVKCPVPGVRITRATDVLRLPVPR